MSARLHLRRGPAVALIAALACLETGRAAAVDPAFLDRAFSQLQSYDWGRSADALLALDEAVAAAHDDSAACRAIEQRLVAILQTTTAAGARQIACRKLAIIGTRDCVPAVAELLTDAQLSHVARFVLERIPDASAVAALRQALPRVRGLLLVGVVNSLGSLADAQAVPGLTPLLRDADPAVAGAAVSALGKVGTLEAVHAVAEFRASAPAALQSRATEACLVGAERLVRRGQRAEAARIFREIYTRETGTWRLVAFRGLVAAEPESATALLLGALAGPDPGLRQAAAGLLIDLPGAQALKPFLDSWATLPNEAQLALLDVARSRRDAIARATALAACDSGVPALRLAGTRCLGAIGTARDVPLLARRTTAGDNNAREAARAALAALPGREPTRTIAEMLPEAAPPVRVELLRALGARGAVDSAPLVVPWLSDADAAVHLAAFDALGALGDEQQASAVIAFLKAAPEDATRSQAEKALGAIVRRSTPKCLEALLAGLPDAEPAARIILLQQLGVLGGSRALEAVRSALTGADVNLRDGAFRVLAAWPDWGAAPDLLKLAGSSDQPAARAVAFRGYVRLCREAPMSPSERLARLSEAAKIASANADKILVASALADLPEPGALRLLDADLDNAAVAEAAGIAVVKIVSVLDLRHKDEAVPVLRRVVKLCPNAAVQKQAREALKRFGAPSE